jgi:hypothetical protein
VAIGLLTSTHIPSPSASQFAVLAVQACHCCTFPFVLSSISRAAASYATSGLQTQYHIKVRLSKLWL